MSETTNNDERPKDANAVLLGMRRRLFPSPVLTRLADDRRGVIVVMFALMLPILLGFMGLGIEVALWYSNKRDMQAAADAAAIAGAYEIAEGRTTNVTARGTAEAQNNGYSSTAGSITINNSSASVNSTFPTSGAFTADSEAVEVLVTKDMTRLFSAWFFTDNSVTVNGRAVATVVAGASTACVLALGAADQSGTLTVSGATNSVVMSGCTMATNSTNANAIQNLSGTMSADCIYSAGGVQGSPTTTACSGARTDQPEITDPYEEAVTKPTDSDFDNCASDGGSFSLSGNGATANIGPAVYCSITMNANNGTLTMSSGTYYIDRGDLKISINDATVDAIAGVTVVFGDSTGSNNCGGLSITGGSLNITAPTSGNFSGLVLYRSSSCDANGDLSFGGGNDSTVIGAVYNPSGGIAITGNGEVGGTCLQLIADTVNFSGDGDIGSACDAFPGVLDIVAGGIGQLVE